jgi:hypothetical protein
VVKGENWRRPSPRSTSSTEPRFRKPLLYPALAHPGAAAIIPGASKPDRIKEDHVALKVTIPADFWRELKKQGLVAVDAHGPSTIKEIDHGPSIGKHRHPSVA